MTRGIHRWLGGLALASATATVLAAAPPQQQTQARTALLYMQRVLKAHVVPCASRRDAR